MKHDVRMRGFTERAEVASVTALLQSRLTCLPAELVPLPQAAGRVLADGVVSDVAVPGFDRAAMDGYAVRGSETFGATPYNPLEFEIVGEALPARPFLGSVGPEQAVRIMTGAPLPAGADAVVPAETAEATTRESRPVARITEAVPPGRHVGPRGEDIQIGQ